ncbi:MAG: fused MFS/spermidine synthase, partial [Anaerolineales bacterium]|nr:fused MFS/spermidine synthase [Anaerolineales bacterium]
MTNNNRNYLFLTVFFSGMSTLAIEFVTSRMLQTVYGTSNIVWANVIGFTLFFLTMGYFLGGRLADRRPDPALFYTLVTIAGASSIFFLLLTSVLLRTAANAMADVNVGAILSSLVGVIFALAIPITLLGCVSPFAIRLGVRDVAEAGRTSGRIYAISTWGSLLGTYLPVLLVIPLAGSRLAALIFGGIQLLAGLIGLWLTNRQRAGLAAGLSLLLIPVAIFWAGGNIKSYPGQLFETESAYNYIQVVESDGCNYLLLNEGQAYHSFYCEDGRVPRISVWSIMLAAPYFRQPTGEPVQIQRMAVVGLAAGTIPKQFTQVYGPVPIDGIELDGAIVQAGRDYFALTDPNINVIIGDGRYELNQLTDQYDIITVDAYKVPYIPWHLTTQQFFEEVRARLTPDGVVAINVGRVPNDRRLVEAMTATLLTVFPTVHAIDIPGSLNTILVATIQETTSDNLALNQSITGTVDPLLDRALLTAMKNIVPATAGEIVFTDERAPVETIIDSLVLGYLLEEGPAGLPGLGG